MVDFDFNGDGRSDVLWQNANGGVSVWLATSGGDFSENPFFTGRTIRPLGPIGDFNGDGRSDILMQNDFPNSKTLLLGAADGSFSERAVALELPLPLGWSVQKVGDFNDDGRDDVLWSRPGYNQVLNVWFGTADGGFNQGAANTTTPGDRYHFLVDATDVNHDGRDDVLWIDLQTRVVGSYLTQSGGAISPEIAEVYGFAERWIYLGAGDFNGDGRDDLFWRDVDSAATSVWWGNAAGHYDLNATSSNVVAAGWSFEQVGDFNGDGREDILWRHASGAMSEWLGNADGSMAVQNLAAVGAGGDYWISVPYL